MCFIFVFAALLEYAVVNYTYWGRRAKKKNQEKKDETSGATAVSSQHMTQMNDPNSGCYFSSSLMNPDTELRFSSSSSTRRDQRRHQQRNLYRQQQLLSLADASLLQEADIPYLQQQLLLQQDPYFDPMTDQVLMINSSLGEDMDTMQEEGQMISTTTVPLPPPPAFNHHFTNTFNVSLFALALSLAVRKEKCLRNQMIQYTLFCIHNSDLTIFSFCMTFIKYV